MPVQEMGVRSLGQEDPLEKGNGNPPQYYCLENPMDRGAWGAVFHGVAKESDTTERLDNSNKYPCHLVRNCYFPGKKLQLKEAKRLPRDSE